jgi:hypothetical protein
MPLLSILCTLFESLPLPSLQKMSSYLKLARIHNMVPSMLLVVVGAWVRKCPQQQQQHGRRQHSGFGAGFPATVCDAIRQAARNSKTRACSERMALSVDSKRAALLNLPPKCAP